MFLATGASFEKAKQLRKEANGNFERLLKQRAQATRLKNKFNQKVDANCEALDDIHKMGQKYAKNTHNGDSTYAEPRRSGIEEIAKVLRGFNLDAKCDAILDAGGGIGTAVWALSFH